MRPQAIERRSGAAPDAGYVNERDGGRDTDRDIRDYYRLEEQGNGVFRIVDPMGVGGNLIVGSERALLIDTGFGIRDIRPSVKKATSLPLIVMNSHVHTDHSGGNYFFDTVYVPGDEMSKLFDGSLDRERDSLFRSWRVIRPHLDRFLVEGIQVTDKLRITKFLPLPEGFDLGDRPLEIVLLGGHTRASSAVVDPSIRTAFVGDAISPTLWLFLHPTGTVAEYVERLTAFSERTDVDWLQLSHKSAPIPFAFTKRLIAFVQRARLDNSEIWPNNRFDTTVYRYAEADETYGELELYFCETNLR